MALKQIREGGVVKPVSAVTELTKDDRPREPLGEKQDASIEPDSPGVGISFPPGFWAADGEPVIGRYGSSAEFLTQGEEPIISLARQEVLCDKERCVVVDHPEWERWAAKTQALQGWN